MQVTPLAEVPASQKIRIQPLEERRAAVFRCVSSWCWKWYAADGSWIGTSPEPDLRKALWLCFGLLPGAPDDVALANAILARAQFAHHHPVRNEAEGRAMFDIFITNHSIQMLVLHHERLTPEVRLRLEEWGHAALDDYPGSRQADYAFRGFNDNMPAKATLGIILGGEYFGDTAAVEHGLWNLRQLRELLTRRGLISEYTSPTYVPSTLLNLTGVGLYAAHPEARRLAAQCVERLWADVLGHYHRPTGTMGGPYSRAYQLDSTGHLSSAACLLWLALGDETAFQPVEEIDREPIRLVHHHDDRPTQLGILAWLASCPMQPPDYLLDWLDRRTWPFHMRASAERGGAVCGEVNTAYYAEEDFALGTSEGEAWGKLQAETFFFQYRRRIPMAGIESLRTAYVRMLVNGQRPGDRVEDHNLKPHGLIHTVQHDRVAMVLASPVPELAGQPVQDLKFSVILPVHFGKVDAIERRNGHVFLRDGPLYLALRPLNATDLGRSESVVLESAPNYQLISFYNYQGKPRIFTRDELGATLNGMIFVAGLAAEESFEDFVARVSGAALLDYYCFDMRITTFQLGDLSLSMSYSPGADRVRYATINGRPVPRPTWDADALSAQRLPFLGVASPETPVLEFPYEHLKVIWGDIPWAIASRPAPGE